MRIYLAAAWRRRAEMNEVAQELMKLGIEIVSEWVYQGSVSTDGFSDVPQCARAYWADAIVAQIDRCQALVLFTEPGEQGHTCTRFAEFGIALGLQKQIVLVGDSLNVLLDHKRVVRLSSREALMDWALDRYQQQEYSPARAAKSLGVSKQAVLGWCRSGALNARRGDKVNGRQWLVPLDEVERMRTERALKFSASATSVGRMGVARRA